MIVTRANLMDSIDGGRYLRRAELPEYASGVYLYPWLVQVYFAITGEIYPIRVCMFDDIPLAIQCALELSNLPAITSLEVTYDVPPPAKVTHSEECLKPALVEWKTTHAVLSSSTPD
jgi:hypothetical protein